MIEQDIVAALAADAGVAARVAARIFPVGGRQGAAMPYLTWLRVSTQGSASLDAPSRLDWPRFQFDCWAASAADALALAAALRTAFEATDLGFFASFQDQRGPEKDPDAGSWRVGQDYLVFHSRSTS